MNDDIIRMAREAGIDAEKDTLCRYEGWVEPLKRFADLAAKRAVSNIDPASWMSWQEGYAAGAAAEQDRCCRIIFGMAGSDNVAQRTVDAIRSKE